MLERNVQMTTTFGIEDNVQYSTVLALITLKKNSFIVGIVVGWTLKGN